MKKIYKSIVLALMFLVFFSGTYASAQYFMMHSDLVGQKATDFTLDTVRNGKVNFTEYRGGQKAIVFFWATWCPHCMTQLKDMNQKKDEYVEKRVKLVIVNSGERKKQVERFISKNKIDLNVFLDESGELDQSYQIIGLPTFYFINEEGVITANRHSLPDDFEGLFSKK